MKEAAGLEDAVVAAAVLYTLGRMQGKRETKENAILDGNVAPIPSPENPGDFPHLPCVAEGASLSLVTHRILVHGHRQGRRPLLSVEHRATTKTSRLPHLTPSLLSH